MWYFEGMATHPLRCLLATGSALLLFAAAAPAQTFTITPAGNPAVGPPPSARQRSPSELFRANCATCHTSKGSAGGTSWVTGVPAPIIAGKNPYHVIHTVRSGRIPSMPAFPPAAISDGELARLAIYVSQLPGSYRAPPPFAATVEILDEDPWFSPPQLTIQPGETVRFVNRGKTYHPVIAEEWLMSGGMEGYNSGPLGPDGACFMKFPDPGKQTVLCGVHPYMRGEIHVGQGFTPPSYFVHAPAPPPAIPGIGEIWVCAQFQDWPGKATDGVIQVIDASNWTVTHQIPVGNNPHNLWFGVGGAEAVVTNWFDVTISRIDPATKTVTASGCVAGAAPAHITSDYDGYYWYATIEGSNYVHRFTQSPGPDELCGSASYPQVGWLGGYGPHGIWYSRGKLVTANSMDSTFSILDAGSLTELALLPAGMMPMGASADKLGNLAAAGCMGMSVSIYDLRQLTYVRDVPVMHPVIQAPFTPDGHYIVAAGGDGVTIIDALKAADPVAWPNASDAIVATIFTGNGAHGVAFGKKAGGGLYAYVTHKFENYVSVIDFPALQKAGDIPLITTTTGKVSLAGSTDTGGNGIAVWPNPAPWQ